MKKTIGRRFSKREVETRQTKYGEACFEKIDTDTVHGPASIELHRRHAQEVLEAAGVDVQGLIEDSPHGTAMRDYVLNYREFDPDSPVGLAARIYELCCHIVACQSMDGGARVIPGYAYRLGRLVMLFKAYTIESERQSEKASAPRSGVTKGQLEKHRDAFEQKHGTLRKWKTTACIDFDISMKTLNRRLEE